MSGSAPVDGLEARPTPAPSAASRRRPAWHPATVAAVAQETPNARRIVLDVPTWPGNDPGQHLDLRLTAEDGYQASRSYSIASAGEGTRVVLAVDRVEGGEVSPFLVDAIEVGDGLDVHGPLGGWFVWRPGRSDRPVQLIAGGSGIVPLLPMVTAHAAADDPVPFRLLAATRTPEDDFFVEELDAALRSPAPLEVTHVYSRRAPEGSGMPVGRLTRDGLERAVFPPEVGALVYVCGSTPFVEQVLRWLGELGHDVSDVRAERFGGAG
ncbi:oxidoreductase [Curtobacterium sp. Csp1]|uniref:FAD-binding oxidoreductase n=1 Tax=Curtobacterium citreum TaxID=2036 RepID=A0ABT2HD12_9MICO|nr:MULTISPECIES: FAD-binding oxidoreductase [Curtobacterium]MCS6521155.1 FAD-binding oxidoreductase [Curtobacterium citreum]QKS14326.1 oxidoreductase [Curtobacterium sp. csp3]QKS18675.1 oxidoreductase [Curtobacterium sp. Csp1]RDH95767.1 ferredoxin-NADP reductase [Curtobacterium sp. AG1037]TQJ28009.1 ferredoxin-NADP reductase [Curtobacterium citreum]